MDLMNEQHTASDIWIAIYFNLADELICNLFYWNSLSDMYIDGLAQGCSSSSALALKLLQSCAKPSI